MNNHPAARYGVGTSTPAKTHPPVGFVLMRYNHEAGGGSTGFAPDHSSRFSFRLDNGAARLTSRES